MKKSDEQHNESMFRGAPQSAFLKAKLLRENMTTAEQKLWESLKENKLNGYKFRRQHPILLYIVDFYCHGLKLVIEVDGEYHLEESQRMLDEERTKTLQESGLTVIRFENKQILNDFDFVIKEILKFFPDPKG